MKRSSLRAADGLPHNPATATHVCRELELILTAASLVRAVASDQPTTAAYVGQTVVRFIATALGVFREGVDGTTAAHVCG